MPPVQSKEMKRKSLSDVIELFDCKIRYKRKINFSHLLKSCLILIKLCDDDQGREQTMMVSDFFLSSIYHYNRREV